MPEVLVDAVETHARLRARRRGAPFFGLLGMAVLVAAGPAVTGASAQLADSVSGTSTLSTMDNEEAMRTLRAFGNCYATRYQENALALMATVPASRGEAETYRRLFRRGSQVCLGGNTELRLPITLVRGAIVEGLYKNGVAVPPELVQSPPTPGAPIQTFGEAARCYVAGHRDQVRLLVDETLAGSRREYETVSEMAPDFFNCLPEAARGRGFNSTVIRYRLAESLYRMPAISTASTGQE